METCPHCDAYLIAGKPTCLICGGDPNAAPATAPPPGPASSAGTEPGRAGPGLDPSSMQSGSDRSAKPRIVVVAVVALIAMIGAAMVLLPGDASGPAQPAAVTPAVDGEAFCARGGGPADPTVAAFDPSGATVGAEVTVDYVLQDNLGWTRHVSGSSPEEIDARRDIVPTAVACLTLSGEIEKIRQCDGYEGGGSVELFGGRWDLAVYEVRTGDLLHQGSQFTTPDRCPTVAWIDNSSNRGAFDAAPSWDAVEDEVLTAIAPGVPVDAIAATRHGLLETFTANCAAPTQPPVPAADALPYPGVVASHDVEVFDMREDDPRVPQLGNVAIVGAWPSDLPDDHVESNSLVLCIAELPEPSEQVRSCDVDGVPTEVTLRAHPLSVRLIAAQSGEVLYERRVDLPAELPCAAPEPGSATASPYLLLPFDELIAAIGPFVDVS